MDASSTFFCKTKKESNGKKPNTNSLHFKSNIQKIKSHPLQFSMLMLSQERKAIKIENEESEVVFEALL